MGIVLCMSFIKFSYYMCVYYVFFLYVCIICSCYNNQMDSRRNMILLSVLKNDLFLLDVTSLVLDVVPFVARIDAIYCLKLFNLFAFTPQAFHYSQLSH